MPILYPEAQEAEGFGGTKWYDMNRKERAQGKIDISRGNHI
jgi:hypothetical protein